MPNIPKPIAFRIYPEGRSLYCRVNVWQNRAEMRAYWVATRGEKSARHHDDAVALATGREVLRVTAAGRARKTGEFCEINCHLGRLNAEIVAHETTHATLRWQERIRLVMPPDDDRPGDVSDEEERFCYALGRMVAQFNDQLHRRGVWAKVKAARNDGGIPADDRR